MNNQKVEITLKELLKMKDLITHLKEQLQYANGQIKLMNYVYQMEHPEIEEEVKVKKIGFKMEGNNNE